MAAWEIYNSALFIGRQPQLNKINAWADSPTVQKRVYSIVAPAGTGKTWLLEKAHHEWASSQSAVAPKRLVITLDVGTFFNRDRTKPLNEDAVLNWIESLHQNTHTICSFIKPQINRTVDPSNIISDFVRVLCAQYHLPYAPIIIVDGYDEI